MKLMEKYNRKNQFREKTPRMTQAEKSPVGGGANSQTKNCSSSPSALYPESLVPTRPDFNGMVFPA